MRVAANATWLPERDPTTPFRSKRPRGYVGCAEICLGIGPRRLLAIDHLCFSSFQILSDRWCAVSRISTPGAAACGGQLPPTWWKSREPRVCSNSCTPLWGRAPTVWRGKRNYRRSGNSKEMPFSSENDASWSSAQIHRPTYRRSRHADRSAVVAGYEIDKEKAFQNATRIADQGKARCDFPITKPAPRPV